MDNGDGERTIVTYLPRLVGSQPRACAHEPEEQPEAVPVQWSLEETTRDLGCRVHLDETGVAEVVACTVPLCRFQLAEGLPVALEAGVEVGGVTEAALAMFAAVCYWYYCSCCLVGTGSIGEVSIVVLLWVCVMHVAAMHVDVLVMSLDAVLSVPFLLGSEQ